MNKVFIDTNIWLYSFIETQDKQKTNISKSIIKSVENRIILSYQVINEICINLLKKANFSERDIAKLIKSFCKKYFISNFNENILLISSSIRINYKISFWDSIITASALENQCNIIYTEDMHHKQIIENRLKVINPFIS